MSHRPPEEGEKTLKPILQPYNTLGSTRYVDFDTSRDTYTGISSAAQTKVISSVPSESCGLQAIDYFLWALQRLYERGEDRYFNYVADHYRLVMDFDDKRNNRSYGRWFSKQDPLTLQKIKPVTG